MDITIRPMTVADAADVGSVHVRAWQAAYRGVMPDAYLDGLQAEDRAAMWREAVAAARPRIGLDVIEADGEIVGFASCGPERDDANLGELYVINFDPAYWRQGLGRRLIRHVTTELTGLGFRRAVLWVEATNDRARRFYEVEGWHADGIERTEDVMGVSVHEVRYARDLPG